MCVCMNIHVVYKISIEVQTVLKDRNVVINSGKWDTIFMSQSVLAWHRKISFFIFTLLSLPVYSNIHVCTFVYSQWMYAFNIWKIFILWYIFSMSLPMCKFKIISNYSYWKWMCDIPYINETCKTKCGKNLCILICKM